MPSFNTEDFWGEETYADVRVEHDNTVFRCYRWILCEYSTHLKALLKNRSVKVVKLEEDDDPEAGEGMLRHIYGLRYAKTRQQEDARRFHLAVLAVADKYDLPELCSKASKSFTDSYHGTGDVAEAFRLLRLLATIKHKEKSVRDIEQALFKEHIFASMAMPDFREPTAHDPILASSHLRALGEICRRVTTEIHMFDEGREESQVMTIVGDAFYTPPGRLTSKRKDGSASESAEPRRKRGRGLAYLDSEEVNLVV